MLHFDDVSIQVARRSPGEPDADELYLIVDPPFAEFNPDIIAEEFHKLFEYDTDTDWSRDGFTIDETRRRTESGASGTAWSLVVEAASQVPAEVISLGLGIVLEKLRSRLGVRDDPPLDRERALNSAQWAIIRATPSLDWESLGQPVGETEDAEQQRWTFTYRPGNGYEYLAEVGWSGTLPGVVRLSRIQNGPMTAAAIVPGSAVVIPGSDGMWIVVDITGDDMAVLRRPDDPDLIRPEARWIRELRLAE